MLCHLIYLSAATSPMSSADLDDILSASRRNNAANGLTGLLLYKGGRFMQVLEGEEHDVEVTFERVRGDSRHKAIDVLRHEYILSRSFADWSMGFGNVDVLDQDGRHGILPLQDVQFEPGYFSRAPSSAHSLLLAFRNELWERL